jgi:peptide deformylase
MEAERLKIVKYGDEILKSRAEDINDIDEEIARLVELMKVVMAENNGIGLAAPQIGRSIRLAIADRSLGERPDDIMVLINPDILEYSGKESDSEGCLSVPGITVPVERKKTILLKSYDLEGKEIEAEYSDFFARVLQHEVDHLNGFLILDRVSPLKRRLAKKEIKKIQEDGRW